MKLIALSVLDVKAECFQAPFFVSAIGVGSRMFADAVNDAQTSVSKHPEDYRLYRVGEFDVVSGSFETQASPIFVAAASDLVNVPVLRSVKGDA